MEKNETNLDSIIADLNMNRNVSNIVLDQLDHFGLTETEKAFFKHYKPEKVLIVYGSLAPNKQNHAVVEHLKGNWLKAVIRGKLEKEGWGAGMGYYGFRHTGPEEQSEIEAFVLVSDELVDNWRRIDDFEGEAYKRILAKYELENGETGVGYIYAINKE